MIEQDSALLATGSGFIVRNVEGCSLTNLSTCTPHPAARESDVFFYTRQPNQMSSSPPAEATATWSTSVIPSIPCSPTEFDTKGEDDSVSQELARTTGATLRGVPCDGELNLPVCGSPFHTPRQIHAKLKTVDQWRQLAELDAEMLVTKQGRYEKNMRARVRVSVYVFSKNEIRSSRSMSISSF